MKIEAVLHPVHYKWPSGEVLLAPGLPVELPELRALRLLAHAKGKVRIVEPSSTPRIQAGDWVEWLSPALPKQQGEVLDVDGDYFTVFHPLSEVLCRLPMPWIMRVVRTTNMEEPTP